MAQTKYRQTTKTSRSQMNWFEEKNRNCYLLELNCKKNLCNEEREKIESNTILLQTSLDCLRAVMYKVNKKKTLKIFCYCFSNEFLWKFVVNELIHIVTVYFILFDKEFRLKCNGICDKWGNEVRNVFNLFLGDDSLMFFFVELMIWMCLFVLKMCSLK